MRGRRKAINKVKKEMIKNEKKSKEVRTKIKSIWRRWLSK